jgi:hypothetical protein
MSSGLEHYPLLSMLWMGVDVAVEKQQCGAYISVSVFMVVSPPMRKCLLVAPRVPQCRTFASV